MALLPLALASCAAQTKLTISATNNAESAILARSDSCMRKTQCALLRPCGYFDLGVPGNCLAELLPDDRAQELLVFL